ncbi:universal stress protein [Phenylobacterium sp.]|uniref:universal stress protein n=1 Tax=Phenylobacterium sp. TaxID=1871053 RepID=UPI0027371EBA|nr:universal stress protein [Phenylobacterium sp.]MDP3852420.1 universal stress protein [Phenylobacterium sp.]
MTYRDILVEVDADPAAQGRCNQVVRLAKSIGAHLSGVFLEPAFAMPVTATGGAWIPPALLTSALEAHEAAVNRAEQQARAWLGAATQAVQVDCDWVRLKQDLARRFIDCARGADLVVVAPGRTPAQGEFHVSPTELAFGCGGPVLVLPDAPEPASVGRRVLVAWNGSREAARAVRDAWPMISGADHVAVAMVSPRFDRADVSILHQRFERRGCKVEVFVETSEEASVSDTLRGQVEDWKADLLVMGLYGRTRLAERILGGVSRDFMDDPPTALLVSH